MSDAAQPQAQSLSEDIAFIRALAVEGRKTPFRGGISLAAGVIWGTASLYSWWAISSASAAGGKWWTSPIVETANWSWLAAAVAFALAGIPLRMYRRAPGSSRTAAVAWGGMGLACWVVSAAVVIAAVRTQQWAIFSVLPPMIMALYGGAWLVSAVAFRAPWQRWLGFLSLLSSLLLAYTAAQPIEYLIFALSLYGLAGLPGLVAVLRPQSNA
jgi:hypothetical protein